MESFDYDIIPVGEQAVNIVFPNQIDITENRYLQQLAQALAQENHQGIQAVIPGYHTLTVSYDLHIYSYGKIKNIITNTLENTKIQTFASVKRVVEIPVCYSTKFGPDLEDVAAYGHLSVDDLIQLHTKTEYFIYMIGFLPGFAYMGTVPKKIAMPRLDQPRTKIPAGSVGIAGAQTGMYPVTSPGGWRLIGQTPLELFNSKHPKLRYQSGDFIRFKAISEAEFAQIKVEDAKGQYQLHIYRETSKGVN